MKISQIALVVLLSAATAFAVGHYNAPQDTQGTATKETAFQRVMRTNKLRCGYVLYDFVVNKDPNTGKMSGIMVEAIDEMGRRLGWEVEWTEELPFMTQFEGLKTGRYDAICTALWGFPETAKIAEFAGPLYYEPIGIWVMRYKQFKDTYKRNKGQSFIFTVP